MQPSGNAGGLVGRLFLIEPFVAGDLVAFKVSGVVLDRLLFDFPHIGYVVVGELLADLFHAVLGTGHRLARINADVPEGADAPDGFLVHFWPLAD